MYVMYVKFMIDEMRWMDEMDEIDKMDGWIDR